jgi:hypothetical protein
LTKPEKSILARIILKSEGFKTYQTLHEKLTVFHRALETRIQPKYDENTQ